MNKENIVFYLTVVSQIMGIMLLIFIFFIASKDNQKCFPNDKLNNHFYGTYASTTAVWFSDNGDMRVLQLCQEAE